MSLTTGVYHETQVLLRCAVHTVNGVLGHRVFSARDFDEICEGLDPRRFLNRHRLFGLGNYDVNVMTIALEKAGCHVRWHDQRLGTNGLLEDTKDLLGYILNVKKFSWFWWGKHWLAVRRAEDGSYWCVDSSLKKPYRFRGPEEVRDYIKCAQGEGGQVLIVRRKQPTT